MDEEKQRFFIKRYQLENLIPCVLTILSIYFWITFLDQDLIKIIGIIVNIVGLIIWWSAKITLGENWDAGYGNPKIKNLVTRGIYSKILHPLYWGINLTLIGLIFLYPSIWFLVINLLIIAYFFYRMRVENNYLLEKLGEDYKSHKRKTWI